MTFDIPAGFPTHRHVTARESLENWGPLHVFDANGKYLEGLVSLCVSTGEVITFSRDADGKYLRDPNDPNFLLQITTRHPAPLSVRPAK